MKIKRILSIIVPVLCLASCAYFSTQKDISGVKTTSLEKFLDNYHKTHPDWLINEVIAKRTNDSLMTLFESVADTIFNDYPMEAVVVREYTSGRYCVNLRAWKTPEGFILNDSIHEIGGDIIALISEKQAMKIKEGDFYTFKGNFIKRTNHEFYQEMTLRRMHYTDDYGVKKHDSFDKNQL